MERFWLHICGAEIDCSLAVDTEQTRSKLAAAEGYAAVLQCTGPDISNDLKISNKTLRNGSQALNMNGQCERGNWNLCVN